jgi:hypothetical protein
MPERRHQRRSNRPPAREATWCAAPSETGGRTPGGWWKTDASASDSDPSILIPVSRDSLRLGLLGTCLAGSVALYVGLAIVLGSIPSGWTGSTGSSLPSAPLFRAFTHLPALALSPAGFQRAVAVLLLALWSLWIVAALLLRDLTHAARKWAGIVVLGGGALMLAMVVVFVPPVLSADLYRQAMFGDMVARHGLNPYATRVLDLAGHPLLPFAEERHATSIYGPLFTWLSAVTVALVPASPGPVALMAKAVSGLAALGCAVLAAALARTFTAGDRDRNGYDVQLWVAWNPLLVIEAAGSGHIEPIMMLPALAGLVLFRRQQHARGFLLLVLSMLTKWVTGILVLLTAAQELRCAERGRKLGALLRLAVPAGLAAALLYAPFVRGLGGGGRIQDMALRGSQVFGDPSQNWIPQWLMTPAFAIASVVVAAVIPRGNWVRLIQAAIVLMLVFVLIVVPWLFPWYFIAPAVLSAALPRDRAGFSFRLVCFGFGAAFMAYYAKLVPLP